MPLEHNEFLSVIFVSFSVFFLSALIRVGVMRSPIPFPHNFVVFLIGILTGILDTYNPQWRLGILLEINPVMVLNFIIPVVMFEASFFTSMESFMISGAQAVLIVFLTFGFSLITVGLLVTYVIDQGWDIVHSIILTSTIVVPGPVLTIAFLKRLAAPVKLQVFLEEEALLGNCLSFLVFRFSVLFMFNHTFNLSMYVRELFISPIWGIIFAKIVAFWISKIIKDSVNQVCIVIASVYMCYLLGQSIGVSGMIAVVAMGVFMTGRRSNMGENTEKVLVRLVHVMSSYFICNMVLVMGLHVVHTVAPIITVRDVYNIILLFIAISSVRFGVILMLSPILRYTGCCLTWHSILVVCLCNIRGAVTMLMSFCVLAKEFKVPGGDKMFVYSLGQVILTLLLNSTLTNVVIQYDVFAEYDEAKSYVLQHALQVLRDIRTNTISTFKHHNKFIADADWCVVEKFAHMRHPLFKIRTNKKKSQDTNVLALERQAVSRILTMMKCSYWKQYEEGMLSRNAVKRLLHWSNHALAKGNSLIFPSKIASSLTVPYGLHYLKENLWSKFECWYFLAKYSPIHQRIKATLFILLYLIDVNLTVMHIADDVFLYNPVNQEVFLWYNLTFVSCSSLIHLVLYTIKSRFFRRNTVSLWELHKIFIFLIGTADLLVMKIVTPERSAARFLRLFMICSRFVRCFGVAEVSPWLLKLLLIACEKHIGKGLSEGYDIGRSYVRGRQEVLRLISHIEKEIPNEVLLRFKKTCKSHKLETTKMLGYLEIEHPTVSVMAKSRQAARIVLKKQLQTIRKLQASRTLDYQDGEALEKVIITKMTIMMGKLIHISTPVLEDIIENVPWVKDNFEVFQFILDKGVHIYFRPGDIIVQQYCPPEGIFIIIDGMPVVKRIVWNHNNVIERSLSDYLMRGNVIGEYSFLTGKPRHKTVTCETNVMAVFIRDDDLWDFLDTTRTAFRQKLSLLEMSMWSEVAMRLTFRLLSGEPQWLGMSQSQILTAVVDGQLVDVRGQQHSFSYYALKSNVMLINGKIVDHLSNAVLHAPIFIARGQTHFTFADGIEERPIILTLPTDVDDPEEEEYNFRSTSKLVSRWNLSTIMDTNSSDVTFSSGSSNSRPDFVKQARYVRFPDCPSVAAYRQSALEQIFLRDILPEESESLAEG